jgi:hypothetical protein
MFTPVEAVEVRDSYCGETTSSSELEVKAARQ